MIGMFVATLPHRIQLNSQWSFDELVQHVREKCLSIFEHSHYPLQYILSDCHINQSNVPFLETVFDFITKSSNIDQLSFGGASFEQLALPRSSEVAKFDFMLKFIYNPTSSNDKLSCRLTCSRDLFDQSTVTILAQRFEYVISQLFSSNAIVNKIDTHLVSFSKLSLILPDEVKEISTIAFCRQNNIVNEGISIF